MFCVGLCLGSNQWLSCSKSEEKLIHGLWVSFFLSLSLSLSLSYSHTYFSLSCLTHMHALSFFLLFSVFVSVHFTAHFFQLIWERERERESLLIASYQSFLQINFKVKLDSLEGGREEKTCDWERGRQMVWAGMFTREVYLLWSVCEFVPDTYGAP